MAKLKVAVTGGIGSGKSLALSYLSQMGYPIFSCDEIYKEVICLPEYIKQVSISFPEVIINGAISREKLATLVFDNPQYRTKINNIAHPLIMRKLHNAMDECASDLVFAEVPLLFEGHYENEFDKILYIYCNQNMRISHVISRDGLEMAQVEKRILSQFNPDSEEGKHRLENSQAYIIKNEGSCEELLNNLLIFLTTVKQ